MAASAAELDSPAPHLHRDAAVGVAPVAAGAPLAALAAEVVSEALVRLRSLASDVAAVAADAATGLGPGQGLERGDKFLGADFTQAVTQMSASLMRQYRQCAFSVLLTRVVGIEALQSAPQIRGAALHDTLALATESREGMRKSMKEAGEKVNEAALVKRVRLWPLWSLSRQLNAFFIQHSRFCRSAAFFSPRRRSSRRRSRRCARRSRPRRSPRGRRR